MPSPFARRLYRPIIKNHFDKNRQMLFLMGPRQVGKTTLCLSLAENDPSTFHYLNWDNIDHREILLDGPKAIAKQINLHQATHHPSILVLDGIHKYSDWKILLKGFFDTYAHSGEVQVVVTGSARLDIYKAGGDSLMGRYFRYRIHPFSCAELLEGSQEPKLIHPQRKIHEEQFNHLLKFGGFPEPLFKQDEAFYRNWTSLRLQQLFYEDLRDLTRIQEIKQMELLGAFLSKQVGALLNYTSLSKKTRVSIETVRRWINTLSELYYSFLIKPYAKDITRSLIKEPKVYLWDWSLAEGSGPRAENFIASHLLKACHYWADTGQGSFELYFLRDKQKREVDFLISRDDKPWFLVEVKQKKSPLSPHLKYFQKETGASHAFQVIIEKPYEDVDCFSYERPINGPASTFLSQLV